MLSNDDDFFSAAFENGPLKTCSFIFSIISGLILLPTMYGIVWYEHYGNDLKRILLNMLVSSVSWVGIVWYVLLQPIEMLRYSYGPLPEVLYSTLSVFFVKYFIFFLPGMPWRIFFLILVVFSPKIPLYFNSTSFYIQFVLTFLSTLSYPRGKK